jgi:hypothetical protein
MGADYFFEKSGEMKKIVTTLVLLAHQPYQEEFGLEREVAQSPVRSPLNPSEQPELSSSYVPATCPRIAASPTQKGNVCFLAGGGSRLPSQSVLQCNS